MNKIEKHIAVIPARSGSKGLKDKNIKNLNGKPMMAYTIEAALESGCFDEIHVSTDSPEYAEIARHYGAQVPFLRPEGLAGDDIGTWQVVKAILKKYENLGQTFETVAVLQPTSPLRRAADIQKAYYLFQQKQAEMVVAVCEAEHSPLWMNTLPADQSMNQFLNLQELAVARQELPVYYRINGAIYLGKTQFIQNHVNYYIAGSYAYVMNKRDSIDIDDQWDFQIAEYLLKQRLTEI